MSLKIRKHYFEKLTRKFKGKKISPLMHEIKIPENLFQKLKFSVVNYISKGFNDNETIINENQIIKKLIKNKNKLKNITPNGIIVPKNHTSLEFNSVLKTYVEILQYFNLENLIQNFHFPPNLRIKFPEIKKNHLSRNHPTELMHSDTWTGANPNWCAVHIFLLGDINKNHIRYASPPKNFTENWLKPLKYSRDGIEISKKFDLINYTPKKGYMIVADATIIHQSFRKKNSGLRVSLDTGFDLKMNKLKSFKKSKIGKFDVKKIRNKETVKKNDFIQIGNKTFFYFPDDLQNKVFHKGGFKHPTNPKLIRLTNK